MEARLINKWVANIVDEHAKETHRTRKSEGLIKDLELKDLEYEEGLYLLGLDEIDHIKDYHYYSGYWKALLWVMNTSSKMWDAETKSNFRPLTEADMLSIYESFLHWRTDPNIVEEDWWAGHGYDSGEFEFDINFVLGYEREDETDPSDWGIWVYPVSPPDYQISPTGGIDVTDEFKAWKLKHEENIK